ncbi:MAG TPA: hypothetical protein VF624_12395 [Tepidisphaeraceae bacterium]
MSPSLPPPLPPRVPPAGVLKAIPVDQVEQPPVESPVRSQARSSAQWPTATKHSLDRARPVWVGVVGIISLCVAAAMLLFAVTAVGFGLSVQMAIGPQRAFVPAAVAAPVMSGNVLSPPEADAVVEGLSRVRPLSEPRAAAVRRLARRDGRQMFRFSGVTASRVAAAVSDSGQMFDHAAKPAEYFVLPEGRLEVDDRAAVYRPEGGAAVRSGPAEASTGLNDPQVNALVAQITSLAGAPPVGQQLAALDRALRDPAQKRVDASIALGVMGAEYDDNGGLIVEPMTGPAFRVDVDGTIGDAVPLPKGAFATPAARRANTAAGWLILTAALGALTALLLIAAAIFWLGDRPRGRRLMLVFAAVQVPLAIGTSISVGGAASHFVTAARRDGFDAPTAMIVAAALAAWPLVVLGVAMRRSVREHFARREGERGWARP